MIMKLKIETLNITKKKKLEKPYLGLNSKK